MTVRPHRCKGFVVVLALAAGLALVPTAGAAAAGWSDVAAVAPGWSRPVPLPYALTGPATTMAVNRAGWGAIVGSAHHRLTVTPRSPRGRLGRTRVVPGTPAGEGFVFAAALNDRGVVAVAWANPRAGIVELRRWTLGTAIGHGRAAAFSAPGTAFSDLALVLGDDGRATAAWLANLPSGASAVRALTDTPAGRRISQTLAPADRQHGGLALGAGRSGRVIATWNERTRATTRLMAAQAPRGGRFRAARVVLTAPGSQLATSRVFTDARGRQLAVWLARAEPGGARTVMEAPRLPGQRFGAPAPVARIGAATTTNLDVAMGPTGRAAIVWATRDRATGVATVRGALRSAVGAWGPPRRLAAGPQGPFPPFPSVTVDRVGRVLALWSASTAPRAARLVAVRAGSRGGFGRPGYVPQRPVDRVCPYGAILASGAAPAGLALWFCGARIGGSTSRRVAAYVPVGA